MPAPILSPDQMISRPAQILSTPGPIFSSLAQMSLNLSSHAQGLRALNIHLIMIDAEIIYALVSNLSIYFKE